MSLLLLYNTAGGGQTVTAVTGHAVLTGKTLTVSQTGHQYIGVVTGHAVLTGKTLTVSRTEHQTMTGTGPVTVTTTVLATTPNLTAALIDDLARWYGLGGSEMVESETSRTDGTLSQTVETVGTTTTLTRI